MKKTNLILYFLIAIVALFILSIYLYSASLTTDIDKLGTFFGGVGSVLIGVITTILLLITMFRQEKSDQDDSIKNETEFILALYSQMERDYVNIYATYTRRPSNVVERYSGQEALNQFVFNHVLGDHPEHLNKYGQFFQADQLHGVTKSFDLLKERIASIPDNPTLATLNKKLDIFYVSKLDYSCRMFNQAFIKHGTVLDFQSQWIVEFYKKYKDLAT